MSAQGDLNGSDPWGVADLRPPTGKRYAVWPMFSGRTDRIVKTSLIALCAPRGQSMFTKIHRIQVIDPGRKIAEISSHLAADSLHESVGFDSAEAVGENYPFPISGPICW